MRFSILHAVQIWINQKASDEISLVAIATALLGVVHASVCVDGFRLNEINKQL